MYGWLHQELKKSQSPSVRSKLVSRELLIFVFLAQVSLSYNTDGACDVSVFFAFHASCKIFVERSNNKSSLPNLPWHEIACSENEMLVSEMDLLISNANNEGLAF